MKKFTIQFPLTDFRQSPPVFFTNLMVYAVATLKDDEIMEVKITSINYTKEGTSLSTDIAPLIELIDSDLHQSIYEACEAHAIDNLIPKKLNA